MSEAIVHKLPIKHKLNNLSDVLITSPADAEVLTYESASAKWKNKAAGAGAAGNAVCVGQHLTISYTNNNYYFSLSNISLVQGAVRTVHEIPFPASTLKKFSIWVNFNNIDGEPTFTVMKNNVATELAVTIPNLQTGWFSDTGSVAVSDGDLLCVKVTGLSLAESGSAIVKTVLIYQTS